MLDNPEHPATHERKGTTMNERPSRRRAAKPARRVRHHCEPDECAGETWRPIAGWGAPYDVSDQGRVRKSATSAKKGNTP